jgi:hypothetical protein
MAAELTVSSTILRVYMCYRDYIIYDTGIARDGNLVMANHD